MSVKETYLVPAHVDRHAVRRERLSAPPDAPLEKSSEINPHPTCQECRLLTAEPFGPFVAELAPRIFTARLRIIIAGVTVVGGFGVALQLGATVVEKDSYWHLWLVGSNTGLVLAIALFGLYLFTDKIVKKKDQRTVKIVGIVLGIYTLAQSVTALLNLFFGS